MRIIPVGYGRKLYLYSDLSNALAWAKDAAEFRTLTRTNGYAVRVAHVGIAAPDHYHKPSGHLANDAIEKIPTMRDFIHAL